MSNKQIEIYSGKNNKIKINSISMSNSSSQKKNNNKKNMKNSQYIYKNKKSNERKV